MTQPHNTTIPPIDAAAPAQVETATFALGCFWGPDAQFGVIPGVVRTRVGYAGGTAPDPTYRNLGDHAETVQLDFDPAVISYKKLLRIFWGSHMPVRPARSRQYMSAVWYHSEAQREAAEAIKAREEDRRRHELFTEIAPLDTFTWAEDYHQKYSLRKIPDLLAEYIAIYPDPAALVNSTAVSRINGFAAGYGDIGTLQAELDQYGLSPQGRDKLLHLAGQPDR